MKILDELSYSIDLLNSNNFSKSKITYNNLSILYKYYKYLGIKHQEIEENLLLYCKKNDEFFNVDKNEGLFNIVYKNGKKYDIRIQKPVYIYEEEINKIKNIKDTREYKFIFTILVLAKYMILTRSKGTKQDENEIDNKLSDDRLYLNNFNPVSIAMVSHIIANNSERMNIIANLYEKGLSEFIRKDRCFITFHKKDAKKTDVPYIIIDDIKRLHEFIPYFCEECGVRFPRSGKRVKYCKSCSKEKFTKKNKPLENLS